MIRFEFSSVQPSDRRIARFARAFPYRGYAWIGESGVIAPNESSIAESRAVLSRPVARRTPRCPWNRGEGASCTGSPSAAGRTGRSTSGSPNPESFARSTALTGAAGSAKQRRERISDVTLPGLPLEVSRPLRHREDGRQQPRTSSAHRARGRESAQTPGGWRRNRGAAVA